jgi:nitrogen fixation protein FixH
VKTHAVASDGEFWIAKVISTISQLEEDKKHVALLENAEEEEHALRVKAKETVESLRKVRLRKKPSQHSGLTSVTADFRRSARSSQGSGTSYTWHSPPTLLCRRR